MLILIVKVSGISFSSFTNIESFKRMISFNVNVHYLLYCIIILWASNPPFLTVVPIVVFSYYAAASHYQKDNTMPLYNRLYPLITKSFESRVVQSSTIMVAQIETMNLFMLMLRFQGLLVILLYIQFLSLRYSASAASRNSIHSLKQTIDNLFRKSWMPVPIKNVYFRITGWVSTMLARRTAPHPSD